jgi:hypothetical protein
LARRETPPRAQRRRLPPGLNEAVLQPDRSLEHRRGITVMLDVLAAVRVRDHQLVFMPVGLVSDFVVQSGLVLLEEPEHRTRSYRRDPPQL